jgi:polyhydroxyalkanoate synthesis regulator phasin
VGLYDFMINASQSGQIADLYEKIETQQKEIEELRKNVEMLSKWVMHLAFDGKEIVYENDDGTTD